jgi:hypothetical protein
MVDLQFYPADIERVLTETFIEQVDYHQEIGSTNNRALQLAKEPISAARLLVLADEQTAGRGRGANSWWTANGALTCSVLLRAEAILLPPSRWPQPALVVGLAVADAIEDCLGDSAAVALKWPNDVYLCNRKVCGILVETADGQNPRLILGVPRRPHDGRSKRLLGDRQRPRRQAAHSKGVCRSKGYSVASDDHRKPSSSAHGAPSLALSRPGCIVRLAIRPVG